MSISYDKLWKLAIDKKMNKTELRDRSGITSSTLSRLSKNQGVSLEALERICRALNCDIGDIMEFKENKVIEVFFKTTKSLLKLQKEFQSRSYDSLISHTTIVFSRYIVLSWQNRCSTDQRTLGGMFYELCDEISELDWAIALQQLIELLEDPLKGTNKKIQKLIKSQLQQWIAGLPNYIKAYLPISVCES